MTRTKEKNHVAVAARYAGDVVSGKIPACQWTIKACQRQITDLEKAKSKDYPYKFDRDKASRICRFIEMLPHIKGEWAKAGGRIELQSWQIFILTTAFGWVLKNSGLRRFKTIYLEMPRKNGKALALDTPIPTPTGWTKMGSVAVGDTVFDASGKPTRVTAISELFTEHQCYRMIFSNGESVIADAGHLWKTTACVNAVGDRVGRTIRRFRPPYLRIRTIQGRQYWFANLYARQVCIGSTVRVSEFEAHRRFNKLAEEDLKRKPLGEDVLTRIRTTEEIFQTLSYGARNDLNHSVELPKPFECPDAGLSIDPYVLGVWLGDGTSTGTVITTGNQDVECMTAQIESCGYMVNQRRHNTSWSLQLRSQEYDLFGNVLAIRNYDARNLRVVLRRERLLGNKHIPAEYLRASKTQRLALFQGLMDTDGTVSKDGRAFEYVTISRKLADGVAELLSSLGIKFSCKAKKMRCNGRPVHGVAYSFQFNAFRDELPVFRLPRKLQRMRNRADLRVNPRSKTVQIVNVEPVDPIPVKCIQVDSPDGMFLFGRTMLPTHNSTFSSGVALYCLCLDGESGGEIYSAATTRDQAKIVWQDAWHMVERSPGLKKTFGVSTTAHAISQIATASRFQALSAEGNSLDGLNIHCAIVDELHAHRTRKVYDVLETATGARTQPLIWSITTAGSDRSGICYEQRTYLTKVLEGVVKDDTYFGVVYTMDEGCDWTDPASWRMANPNFGVSVFPDDLERLCLKAQKMPSAQNNFLTKRLSVWVNADVTLFDLAKWQSLGDPKLKPENFIDAHCWIGLDFAPRHDFTSRVLLFRRGEDYYVFAKHFLSEGEVEESDNAQYSGWAREGWIHTNEGNQTDDRELEDDVVGIIEAGYQVQEIDCDPSRLQGVQTRISERTGATAVDILQNVRNLSAPTKKLDALIADGRIHHDGDPVLAWMLSNVVGHYDRKENVYPVKERPENKIDGAIALIIALARAMVGTGPVKNIYETRGPIFV
jgi:phage terminase large subunit-like protein